MKTEKISAAGGAERADLFYGGLFMICKSKFGLSDMGRFQPKSKFQNQRHLFKVTSHGLISMMSILVISENHLDHQMSLALKKMKKLSENHHLRMKKNQMKKLKYEDQSSRDQV